MLTLFIFLSALLCRQRLADFNDCVHPLSRALIEGLFGFHPDRPSGSVTFAPQFPSSWPNASITTPDFSLKFLIATEGSTSLNVSLAQGESCIIIKLPLRAQAVGNVVVAGLPIGASWNFTVAAGFGQAIVTVAVYAQAGGLVSAAEVTVVAAGAPLAYAPSISVNASAGQKNLTLWLPAPYSIVAVLDPQGVFVPGSIKVINGTVVGDVDPTASVGHYLVIVNATVGSGDALQQLLQFKISVPPVLRSHSSLPLVDGLSTSWAYVSVADKLNADVSHVFDPNTYLSPRPQTCGVRIGTDGWSAWTFPLWGSLTLLSLHSGIIIQP